MSTAINKKAIKELFAMGQLMINKATELNNAGTAATSTGARKGITKFQKQQLISKRLKTAFKQRA